MTASPRPSPFERFRRQAEGEGLTICWIVARERIDPRFTAHVSGHAPGRITERMAGRATIETTAQALLHTVDQAATGPAEGAARPVTPADLHPRYRRAILLGSGGSAFWERFRATDPDSRPAGPAENPLDRYTERRVEALLEPLREDDPDVVAAYPFRHARQLLPFRALTEGLDFLGVTPFGVSIDPAHGPWFAWRAALLTAAAYPESPFPAAAPCVECPAPCEAACPVEAVHVAGFRWQDCIAFRLAEQSCRERCLAREACPVGPRSRYPVEEIRYHSRASLRTIRLARGISPEEDGP